MCFITVKAATVLVNVVYHGNERHGTVIVFFHGNVTTVITAVALKFSGLFSVTIFEVGNIYHGIQTPR